MHLYDEQLLAELYIQVEQQVLVGPLVEQLLVELQLVVQQVAEKLLLELRLE
jgi:hypothetical protein